jgi:hypothetical protein
MVVWKRHILLWVNSILFQASNWKENHKRQNKLSTVKINYTWSNVQVKINFWLRFICTAPRRTYGSGGKQPVIFNLSLRCEDGTSASSSGCSEPPPLFHSPLNTRLGGSENLICLNDL